MEPFMCFIRHIYRRTNRNQVVSSMRVTSSNGSEVGLGVPNRHRDCPR